jgi:hypothetical protein
MPSKKRWPSMKVEERAEGESNAASRRTEGVMKYLLDQSEIDNLMPKKNVDALVASVTAARIKILELAKFDCIHKENGQKFDRYCDDCPCSPIHSTHYAVWDRICGQEQNYSK